MHRRHLAPLTLCLLAASAPLLGCRSEDRPSPERVASDVAEPVTGALPLTAETALNARAERPEYRCVTPPIPIPRPLACERGRPYPVCKWNLPHALESRGSYRRWRNTIPEHRWGRPGLVSLLLSSAAEYHERFADQILSIGDLDAPGPRHQTHDRGVDVDIYLPGAMITENVGGGRYLENYEGRSEDEVEGLRERVQELARILAVCSRGQLRIYYNDPLVVESFNQWFAEQDLESPFGEPMQLHNDLHRFHFHMTVSEGLPPLPRDQEPREADPIRPIPRPPSIVGVTMPEPAAEAESASRDEPTPALAAEGAQAGLSEGAASEVNPAAPEDGPLQERGPSEDPVAPPDAARGSESVP